MGAMAGYDIPYERREDEEDDEYAMELWEDIRVERALERHFME